MIIILILYIILFTDAFDVNLMIETLKGISQGKTVQIATYDFATCQRFV